MEKTATDSKRVYIILYAIQTQMKLLMIFFIYIFFFARKSFRLIRLVNCVFLLQLVWILLQKHSSFVNGQYAYRCIRLYAEGFNISY